MAKEEAYGLSMFRMTALNERRDHAKGNDKEGTIFTHI